VPTVDAVVQSVHPDDRARAREVIDRVSKTGTEFEHEYRLLMPGGRVKHVHAIAHAVITASGNGEFVGVVTDITERKSAEDRVRLDADPSQEPRRWAGIERRRWNARIL
jgi:PAS domain S-box-containing protein